MWYLLPTKFKAVQVCYNILIWIANREQFCAYVT